jgi:predicted nucleotidyltransferase
MECVTREGIKLHHDRLYKELITQYVPYVCDQLASRGGCDFIILFGSRARGDYAEESDFDLFICSSAFQGIRYLDRSNPFDTAPFSGVIEVICYTPEEVLKSIADFHPTLIAALEEGKVLYEKGSILQKARNIHSQYKLQGKLRVWYDHGKIQWQAM